MLRKFCALLVLAFSLTGIAHAEQKVTVGNFDIHYIAFGSTFITPKVAQAYGITRSKNVGIINISVLDTKQKGSPGVPVQITGMRKNLMDSHVPLNFKEVKEGKAVYYIAQVPYNEDETFNFDINIKYKKELNTKLKFNHKFYVE
ncbi:DUF4426 domain-containing protein [Shewanella sp. 202IG2-18]|uniref:DUF4426 domain-containing protein n=1 Tax=Parashewanella hymeniacidonis TaxID=2807618 RepID=UPI001960BD77|nr:DUF4426 domain-containing protein [Parashewanella hymeniacidonis]MBM7072146.1 DUF4426 domain-containing protein [Parashewanella hymeniacidonis]